MNTQIHRLDYKFDLMYAKRAFVHWYDCPPPCSACQIVDSVKGTLGRGWKRVSFQKLERTWPLWNWTIKYLWLISCRYHGSFLFSTIQSFLLFPLLMIHSSCRKLDWMTVEERVMTNIIIENKEVLGPWITLAGDIMFNLIFICT